MANITNIPTGLNIPSQIPLDTIAFNQSESLLSNLGTDNYLAFKYYEGLVVHCINEDTDYKWREVGVNESNTGLIPIDFTYPNNHIVYGIDYSNRVFNFFKVNNTSNNLQYDCDNINKIPTPLSEGRLYKEEISNNNINKFRFRTIHNNDGTVELTEDDSSIRINSKVFINQGNNVTITGNGTSSNPFVINSSITGASALLEDSFTTHISGNGVLGNEYQVDVKNLQKVVSTFPYTLIDSDDKYTIFINNESSNVIINVPDNLINNFTVAFVQKGTGNVSIIPNGTSVINTTLGYKIKGQYNWVLLEKELSTVVHYLIGNTKL